jgi:hypothetical protein
MQRSRSPGALDVQFPAPPRRLPPPRRRGDRPRARHLRTANGGPLAGGSEHRARTDHEAQAAAFRRAASSRRGARCASRGLPQGTDGDGGERGAPHAGRAEPRDPPVEAVDAATAGGRALVPLRHGERDPIRGAGGGPHPGAVQLPVRSDDEAAGGCGGGGELRHPASLGEDPAHGRGAGPHRGGRVPGGRGGRCLRRRRRGGGAAEAAVRPLLLHGEPRGGAEGDARGRGSPGERDAGAGRQVARDRGRDGGRGRRGAAPGVGQVRQRGADVHRAGLRAGARVRGGGAGAGARTADLGGVRHRRAQPAAHRRICAA